MPLDSKWAHEPDIKSRKDTSKDFTYPLQKKNSSKNISNHNNIKCTTITPSESVQLKQITSRNSGNPTTKTLPGCRIRNLDTRDNKTEQIRPSNPSHSPSKLEVIKTKIEEQKKILKTNVYQNEQKKLLYDFLEGNDTDCWDDEELATQISKLKQISK